MQPPPTPLRHTLTWAQLWPSVRTGLAVTALFAVAVLLARSYALPAQELLASHPVLGPVVFVATSALAVLLPLLTNLPLVPFAVLAWGPSWTAALLLGGWVLGATLSFALGRYASRWVLRHLPSAKRHADIDRLIDPDHRMLSLTLLRMTFPVDLLSYALGLFSRSTTMPECMLSTAIGAAPFAILFALFPTLSAMTQALVFAASAMVFTLYALWVLRRTANRP